MPMKWFSIKICKTEQYYTEIQTDIFYKIIHFKVKNQQLSLSQLQYVLLWSCEQ